MLDSDLSSGVFFVTDLEFSVYFLCGNTLPQEKYLIRPAQCVEGKIASFTCTQTQLPPLSPILKALSDFAFLRYISAPFTPAAEPENDH